MSELSKRYLEDTNVLVDVLVELKRFTRDLRHGVTYDSSSDHAEILSGALAPLMVA